MKAILALLAILLYCVSGCNREQDQQVSPFLIINMSLPRSATTSFAGIFQRYRSTHEFMISETINTLMDYREGKISPARLRHFLKDRDRRAGHQVDSASFFFLAPEIVMDTFPDAKYFLAVRTCESWIVSMVDNSVFAHKMIKAGKTTVDLSFLDRYSKVFIRDHRHASFENLDQLRRDSSHIVSELAKFWGETSLLLLNAMLKVQKEKRLIIHMEDFNQSTQAFARLAGIPVAGIHLENQHLNRDRDMAFYRKLLSEKKLTDSCSPHQKNVDSWFDAHASEVN